MCCEDVVIDRAKRSAFSEHSLVSEDNVVAGEAADRESITFLAGGSLGINVRAMSAHTDGWEQEAQNSVVTFTRRDHGDFVTREFHAFPKSAPTLLGVLEVFNPSCRSQPQRA